jgi:hypothetical protein
MQIQIAGLAWFEEDDYESFRAVLPDRRWHPTFDAWREAAEQNANRLEARGIRTIKAKVRSNDFIAWCGLTGRDVDSEALTAYANEAAMRSLSQREMH